MIKSQQQEIGVRVDAISFVTDIKVLAGNPVQTFNNDTKEYEPDRSLVPCLIMPYVSVSDPENIMSGSQEITSCLYFEGPPADDYSNQITSSTDGYVISKAGTPVYSLTVQKNFEVDKPVDIHAVYTITDKRTNKALTFEKQLTFTTGLYESSKQSLKLDCEEAWEIDVTQEKADANGRWLHTITGQLYKGMTAVDDANAAYWWQVSEDGKTYRDFTDDELNLVVSGKDASGYWSKTLTFDARMFRKASFRLTAAYYEDVRPSGPTLPHLQATTTVKMIMPPTLDFLIQQESGMKVNAAMNTTVKFTCTPRTNRGAIAATDLFRILWIAASGKSGVAEKQIGEGLSVSFNPSSLGFDKNYSMSVYAKIYVYAVHAIVTSGGAAITNNGAYVTIKQYE